MALANKATKHVHKLRRHTYSTGKTTYFCVDGNCTYKVAPGLALGKLCICWRCGAEFNLDEYAVRLAKPHCRNCHIPKKGRNEPVEEVNEVSTPTLTLAERLKMLSVPLRHENDSNEEDI